MIFLLKKDHLGYLFNGKTACRKWLLDSGIFPKKGYIQRIFIKIVNIITSTCLKYNTNTWQLNNQLNSHCYHVVELVVEHKLVVEVVAVVDNIEVVVVVGNMEVVVVVDNIAVGVAGIDIVVEVDVLFQHTQRCDLEVEHLDVGTR